MKIKDAMKIAGLTHQEPPPLNERVAPDADKYRRHKYIPCPFCHKIMYERDGVKRQAVTCLSTRNGVAYLRSHCCPTKGEKGNGVFKLPME